MAESCLKDLLNWSRHVDHEIRQLELLVERNGIPDTEVDPDQVVQKFEDIIADVGTMKTSARNDMDDLKRMSDESKELFALIETDELKKIGDELKVMLTTLFPEEASAVVSESVPAVGETDVQNTFGDGDSHVPVPGTAPLSPISNSSTGLEESFTEVEITPGLITKVPKSRLGHSWLANDARVASSVSYAYPLHRPLRKKTLIFSPSGISETSRSPTIPTTVLQECRNWNTTREEFNAKSPQCDVEEAIMSPEILERPTKPVLSSVLYGLLN